MSTFENILNQQITEAGLRVSPRLSTEERLVAFLRNYTIQQGVRLDEDELGAVAGLLLLRGMTDDTNSTDWFNTTLHQAVNRQLHYISLRPKQHVMTRRSMTRRFGD